MADYTQMVQATPTDYLVRTLLAIFGVTEGEVWDRYKIRFNNIVFNNFPVISQKLTLSILLSRATQSLFDSLSGVNYVSVVYPHTTRGSRPVLLQYFNKATGVEQRLVKFAPDTDLVDVLVTHHLLGKLVGFCGDYCYKDASNTGSPSGYISTLKTVIPKMFHVPYSDGILDRLFDMLLDYLPADVIKPLVQLGETVQSLGDDSQLAKEVVTKYKEWSQSSSHILGSNYTQFVLDNYDSIYTYLKHYTCLPRTLGTFFSRLTLRFYLSFMREVYNNVRSTRLSDNSAVAYYAYLEHISMTFSLFEDGYVLSSWNLLHKEIPRLGIKKSEEFSFIRDVHALVDQTYTRAVKYLEPLLRQFQLDGFDAHKWVLTNPLSFDQVHNSYHLMGIGECDHCHLLQLEVSRVNKVLAEVPIVGGLAQKWVTVLGGCKAFMVQTMLEVLLSIPAFAKLEGGEPGSDVEEAELAIRMNTGGVAQVEGGWSEEELVETAGVIRRWQISRLAD